MHANNSSTIEAAADTLTYPPSIKTLNRSTSSSNSSSANFGDSEDHYATRDEAETLDRTAGGSKNGEITVNESASLPPVDTGYAWVFLGCAFTAE
jgi:hypothetical protein